MSCASGGHPRRITVPANFNGQVMATRLRRHPLAENRIRTLTDYIPNNVLRPPTIGSARSPTVDMNMVAALSATENIQPAEPQ